MMFSDSTNDTGLVQDIDFLCGTTDDTYPINDKTRNINQHYHQAVADIWEASDGWQYDDSNHADLPIATTDLVDNQQDYEIPSTAQRVERVEVLDSNSNYQKLRQIDWNDIKIATSEYLETNGMPLYYDLVGRSIFLYPTPASGYVTTSAGLKLYFNRDIDEFVPGDTTQEPGFAKPFHRILSLGAAIDYLRDDARRERLIIMKTDLQKSLQRFYGKRMIERRPKIIPSNKRYQRQYL